MIDRRFLLKCAAAPPVLAAAPLAVRAAGSETSVEKADHTLRIATGLVELSPDHIMSTALYNGQFPGPLIRLQEGKRVVVDIQNDTDVPELPQHEWLTSRSSVRLRCERMLAARGADL